MQGEGRKREEERTQKAARSFSPSCLSFTKRQLACEAAERSMSQDNNKETSKNKNRDRKVFLDQQMDEYRKRAEKERRGATTYAERRKRTSTNVFNSPETPSPMKNRVGLEGRAA